MRSLKSLDAREDWGHLQSLAQDELQRVARRPTTDFDDRSRAIVEHWTPLLKDLGPKLASDHLADYVSVGRLVDDLRDLSFWFRPIPEDPLRRTKVLLCSALVVASRAHIDYAPPTLFGYIRLLVHAAREERKQGVVSHIAAVLRGRAGAAPASHW